ncbi:hypothetical protein [Marinomonas sp. FW-1]|uniref:hypothetical protein n=1 Tax=Marinomonas sp. FW-1 TaxID=2071621 RepID=UPI0010C03D90|nr:hypothetical protein [Marinomonas sp. FW-1]
MSNEAMNNKKTDTINGSFTLSESPDEKLQGEFIVSKSVNKIGFFSKYITLNLILKIIPILVMYAGVYGFAYQKGMVSEMGLENVDFNYEIKEIYFFAFLGVEKIASNFIKINYIPDLEKIFFMAGMYGLAGFISHFFISKDNLIKNYMRKKDIKFFSLFKMVVESWWISTLIWSGIGAISSFVFQIFLKFSLAIAFFLLLFPGFVGFWNGTDYVEKLKMEEDICVIPEMNKEYETLTRFCPKLVVKGQALWGEIVLSTSNAYFLRKKAILLMFLRKKSLVLFPTI